MSTLQNSVDARERQKQNPISQQLYPDLSVTLATADALLILEYATGRINNHK
jgi:hypothetical protein